MSPLRAVWPFAVFALSAGIADAEAAEQPDWEDVARIFAKRCINCHAEHGASKGLRLDSYDGAIAGSDNGPVLLPGDPLASEMIRRLRGESAPRMPFLSTPLPQAEIDLIVRWVVSGLPEVSRGTSSDGGSVRVTDMPETP